MALKKTFRSIMLFLLTIEYGQIPECGQHPALVSSIFALLQNSYMYKVYSMELIANCYYNE